MINKSTSITTVEELLNALGAEKPFDDDQNLTEDGDKALGVLFEVIKYLTEEQVIDGIKPDKLDELIYSIAY